MDLHVRRLAIGLLVLLAVACSGSRRRVLPQPTENREAGPAPGMTPIWYGSEGKTAGKKAKKAETAKSGRVVPRASGRPARNTDSPLGVNLAAVGPESREWVFLDLFKMASPWWSGTAKKADGRKLDLDEQGWVQSLLPDQVASVRIPTMSGGRFIMTYDGRGLVSLQGGKVERDDPGRLIYSAPAKSTVVFSVETTNVQEYVRNVKVLPERYENRNDLFHPLFLDRAQRFSVLRFADWLRIGQSGRRWADRTLPDAATQASPNGVAYELVAMLANELSADAWINVPHDADDAYVTSLATFLRENLDPDRKVYVEYSHELWAPALVSPQAAYVRRQGVNLGLDTDPVAARLRFQSQRSVEIFELFEGAFGGTDRLVRVMSGQLGVARDHVELLSYDKAFEKTDALAVAPSFGRELGDAVQAREWKEGVGPLLDRLEEQSVPEVLALVRESARAAKRFGVALIAYSGGQHLLADADQRDNALLNQRFDEANRNPRMRALYSALLSGWQKNGGELFVHAGLISGFGKDGRFGALESVDTENRSAPKYEALLGFIDNHPRWWTESRPATVPVAKNAQPPPAPPPPAVVEPKRADLTTAPDFEGTSPALRWTLASAGWGALAGAAVLTGLSLQAGAERDRLLAADFAPFDGAPARSLDNQSFSYSLGAGALLAAGVAGLGTATIMRPPPDPNALDFYRPRDLPAEFWWASGTAALGLVSSGVYFWAYRNSSSARDALRTSEMPLPSSAPIRQRDDEAYRWSAASLASFGVAALGAGTALVIYWLETSVSVEYQEEAAVPKAPSPRVLVTPLGVVGTW